MTNGNSAERYDGDSEESRRAFRDYGLDESVASKTPWQVWRDACAWQARAALSVGADGGKGEAVASFDIYAVKCGDADLDQVVQDAVAWVIPDIGSGEYSGTTITRSKSIAMLHNGRALIYADTAPQAECAPRAHEPSQGEILGHALYEALSAQYDPRADGWTPSFSGKHLIRPTPDFPRADAEKDAALSEIYQEGHHAGYSEGYAAGLAYAGNGHAVYQRRDIFRDGWVETSKLGYESIKTEDPNKELYVQRTRGKEMEIDQSEYEKLLADALRYRWLRQQNWNESDMAVVCHPKKSVKLGFDCPSGQRLDDAIDAAIKKEQGNGL